MRTKTYANAIKLKFFKQNSSGSGIFSKWLILSVVAVAVLSAGISLRHNSAAEFPTLSGRSAIEHLKRNGSFGSLAGLVESEQYRVNSIGTDLSAANAANELQMNFTTDGMRLNSNDKKNSWVLGLRLNSFGYGKNQRSVAGGTLRSNANRVELVRSEQNVTEWFENSSKGVEHGFTLAQRPDAQPSGKPLRMIMTLDGDLTARTDADGQALTLLKQNGETALRYEKLKVWDADGKGLTARLLTEAQGQVWIDVDDSQAAYPVTIDPTFIQAQKLTADNGVAGDQFGGSVAISGTTAIVGASAYGATTAKSGAAYVYTRSGSTWSLQQKLTASDGEADDAFGWDVAIDGETVVVGAFGDTIGGAAQQGSAYVFTRSNGVWTQQQKLTASDGAANDLYGWSVAISGETIAVGANSDDLLFVTNGDQGSAYIYLRSGTTWSEQAKIAAGDASVRSFFGDSIALAGDTVIVGATENTVGANTQQGSAYIFTRSGTSWTQQQKLTASDGAKFDFFGFSVALSGDTAIVGTLQNIGNTFQRGSAYIFVRSGTTWTQQQKLTAADGVANSSFGGSVALVGDRVVIGAYGDPSGANLRQGSAYMFTRSGTVWTQQQKFTADDGAAEDSLGSDVALSSDTAIVTAMNDTVGANLLQGSAYAYMPLVTVGGKVTTPTGAPLRNATVTLTDSFGDRRVVTTNAFGNYSFLTVVAGPGFRIAATSKRYRFTAMQNVLIDADLLNADFAGFE